MLPFGQITENGHSYLRFSVIVSPRLMASSSADDRAVELPRLVVAGQELAGHHRRARVELPAQDGHRFARPISSRRRLIGAHQPDSERFAAMLPGTTPVTPYSYSGFENRKIRSAPVGTVVDVISNLYGEFGTKSPTAYPAYNDLVPANAFGALGFEQLFTPREAPAARTRAFPATASARKQTLVQTLEGAFANAKAIPYDLSALAASLNPAIPGAKTSLAFLRAPALPAAQSRSHSRAGSTADATAVRLPPDRGLGDEPADADARARPGARLPGRPDRVGARDLRQRHRAVRASRTTLLHTGTNSKLPAVQCTIVKDGTFRPLPKDPNNTELALRMLKVGDPTLCRVVRVDHDSSVVKTMQFANTVTRSRRDGKPLTLTTPDRFALPALRTGGFAVARSGRAVQMAAIAQAPDRCAAGRVLRRRRQPADPVRGRHHPRLPLRHPRSHRRHLALADVAAGHGHRRRHRPAEGARGGLRRPVADYGVDPADRSGRPLPARDAHPLGRLEPGRAARRHAVPGPGSELRPTAARAASTSPPTGTCRAAARAATRSRRPGTRAGCRGCASVRPTRSGRARSTSPATRCRSTARRCGRRSSARRCKHLRFEPVAGAPPAVRDAARAGRRGGGRRHPQRERNRRRHGRARQRPERAARRARHRPRCSWPSSTARSTWPPPGLPMDQAVSLYKDLAAARRHRRQCRRQADRPEPAAQREQPVPLPAVPADQLPARVRRPGRAGARAAEEHQPRDRCAAAVRHRRIRAGRNCRPRASCSAAASKPNWKTREVTDPSDHSNVTTELDLVLGKGDMITTLVNAKLTAAEVNLMAIWEWIEGWAANHGDRSGEGLQGDPGRRALDDHAVASGHVRARRPHAAQGPEAVPAADEVRRSGRPTPSSTAADGSRAAPC